MRFHSSGPGDMVPTANATKEHRQMVNTAVKHCPRCMHFIDGKASLSLSREDDVIIAYIRDPHNAHWAVRDEQDRKQAELEELSRQYKPWRQNWGKRQKIVDSTAVVVKQHSGNPGADALLDALRKLL